MRAALFSGILVAAALLCGACASDGFSVAEFDDPTLEGDTARLRAYETSLPDGYVMPAFQPALPGIAQDLTESQSILRTEYVLKLAATNRIGDGDGVLVEEGSAEFIELREIAGLMGRYDARTFVAGDFDELSEYGRNSLFVILSAQDQFRPMALLAGAQAGVFEIDGGNVSVDGWGSDELSIVIVDEAGRETVIAIGPNADWPDAMVSALVDAGAITRARGSDWASRDYISIVTARPFTETYKEGAASIFQATLDSGDS